MCAKEHSPPTLYTDVCLETDLEEPLLLKDPKLQDGEDKPGDNSAEDGDSEVKELYPVFRVHGLLIGFLAQLVNVSGTTYMYFRWGDVGIFGKPASAVDFFWHFLVWALSQADLCLYLVMWLSLTFVLTKGGVQFVRERFFPVRPSKRSIFVLGVQFYVGVVLGVFSAWLSIDVVLGLPVPVLPMVAVLIFGLCISYTMVWCYDMEDVTADCCDEEEEDVIEN